MSQKKTYQQRKERRNKVRFLAVIVVLALMTALFAGMMLQDIRLSRQVRSGALREYCGGYSVIKRQVRHNITYFIVLDNGDVLYTPFGGVPEGEELYFVYSSSQFGIRHSYLMKGIWRSYSCVSIEGADGTAVYLSQETVLSNAKGNIAIFAVFTGLGILGSGAFAAVMLTCPARKRKQKK